MEPYKIEKELNALNAHKSKFDKLRNQANIIIYELHNSFKKDPINIAIPEIIDNSINFSIWGVNISVKTEIAFDKDKKGFYYGELNTYVNYMDNEFLILTYNFDSLGNIENRLLPKSFAIIYYLELMSKVFELTSEKSIKFQLK